jgi:hypothetical protein
MNDIPLVVKERGSLRTKRSVQWEYIALPGFCSVRIKFAYMRRFRVYRQRQFSSMIFHIHA